MIVESLDTFWLMGLRQEYAQGRDWVEHHLRFDGANHEYNSFFETTIRVLGGLLGAYALSKDEIYAERSRELGDRLLVAFGEDGGVFPVGEVDVGLKRARHFNYQYGQYMVSEVGSCTLEFRYLSHITGDPKYAQVEEKNVYITTDANLIFKCGQI